VTAPALTAHPVDLEPSMVDYRTYASRRRLTKLDAASVFGITICLLTLIPARLTVPTLTALGRPALIMAMGMFVWWLLVRLDPWLAMTAVIWVDSWKMTPLYAIIFLAALQAIPKDLYETAAIEGANRWQTFRFVTLPILTPIIVIVLILRMVLVFQAFDFIYILTDGGPGDSTRVIAFYAYQEAFQFLERGRGAAVAVIIFVCTVAITVLYAAIIRIGRLGGSAR